MKKSLKYGLVIALICFLVQHVSAQVSHGGSPVMNAQDFKAEEVIYLLPPLEPGLVEGLKNASVTSTAKALQYATERTVDISPDYNGEWTLYNGTKVWRAHLISPEAYSLGLFFSEFNLNQGARLFLYSPDGKVIKGAYNYLNNKEYGSFYVGHIPGEEIIVELQVDKGIDDYGLLRLGSLSHAFLPVYAGKSAGETGLGTSQDCEIDVNCSLGDDWQVLKRSVCHISTSKFLCTGALVNNTSYNGRPYVLTAEHCVNNNFYARSSVYYFGFENSECGATDASLDNSISGSEVYATGGDLDFTLLKLSVNPPREYNVYYAGWDVRDMEHTGTVALHHPNGDAMKISIDNETTSLPVSVPGDLNDYIIQSNFWIRQWDYGTTEGGSSGGPLFNNSKRLIGNLSGGLAVCGDSIGYDAEKDLVIYGLSDNRNDYYSRLSYNWEHYPNYADQLKNWLDPINTGALSIGGLNSMAQAVDDFEHVLSTIRILPNPSAGQIQIQLNEYTGKKVRIRIFDITGRSISTMQMDAVYPMQMDLSQQARGIYLLHIDGNGYFGSSRFILD